MRIRPGIRSLYAAIAILAAATVGGAHVLKSEAASSTIYGRAYVLDADTVRINGTTIRLKGVDAAEMNTARGEAARRTMVAIVGNSPLTCILTGEKTRKREVGFCTTADGVDINQEIISRGAALACARYSTRYVSFERKEALAAQPRSSYCLRGAR